MPVYGCQAQFFALYRPDILIHPEQICRVVLALQLHQPVPGGAIREGDTVGLLLGEKVDVGPAAGKRLGFRKKFPCPGDAMLILGGGFPAAVHVQHVVRVPAGVRHGLGHNAGCLAANRSDEDLAMR